MERTRVRAYCAALILAGLCGGPGAAAGRAAQQAAEPGHAAVWKAAAGKIDVTPDPLKKTVWLAGYGASGRRAAGVRDPLYVRGMVVSDGMRTVAFIAVDSIGIYRNDVLEIRRRLGWDGRSKYLFLTATHDHSAPDSLGLWGRFVGVSGVDPEYHGRLKDAAVKLIGELSAKLEPAVLEAARLEVDPGKRCKDSRDPVVLDPEMNIISFRRPSGGRIGTMVRWSCHAEVLGSDNTYVTADFPGALCARFEKEAGGACMFVPGAIGGLQAPVVDRSPGVEHQFARMRALGNDLAQLALSALRKADRFERGSVFFDSRIVKVPVENSRYIAFLRNLAFGHDLFDSSGAKMASWKKYWYPLRHAVLFPLPERLRPWVETEVSLIRLGPVRILGMPGELFPESAVGGYDGKYRFSHPLVRPDNPNPPELNRAPKGPYLRERLGAKHGLIIGLANDQIGYIVPKYDFEITDNRIMAPRPPGTHYEETNSIGSRATAILLEAARGLMKE